MQYVRWCYTYSYGEVSTCAEYISSTRTYIQVHLISFHLLTPIDTRLSYLQPFTFPVLLLYIIKTVKISSKVLTAHQHACIIHHLLSIMTDIKTDKYKTDKHCPVGSSTPKRSTATPCCGYVKELISMSKASFL